jgi:predicted metal-dependent HD superfamily phosphohydrolase
VGSVAAEAWIAAVRQLGGSPEAAAAGAAELDRHYAEPHRRYHGAAHVDQVVRDSSWLAAELGLDADERAWLCLAAAAHDVVYEARPGDDERASAAWARRQLEDSGVAAESIERVVALVLATATHAAPAGDTVAIALLDADLAILGTDPDGYARYVAGVREEYAAVPDDQWRVGRSDVLAGLLRRDRIFVSRPGCRRWEAPARANVGAELARLRDESKLRDDHRP